MPVSLSVTSVPEPSSALLALAMPLLNQIAVDGGPVVRSGTVYVGNYYRDLALNELMGEGERYAAYRVSGLIANVGPEDAVGVTLTVTLYDALGRVIGTRRGVPGRRNC